MSDSNKPAPGQRTKWSDPMDPNYVPPKIATPEDAASIIIAAPVPASEVAAGDSDFKVLMIKRSAHGFFGSLTVFPGGKVDHKADGSDEWTSAVFSQAQHAVQLQRQFPESHNLKYAIAAVREAFEETGTLLVEPRRSAAGMKSDEIETMKAGLKAWRDKINKNASEFAAFCKQANVAPAVRKIQPFSRWLTPPSVPKRFDTRFFLTCVSQSPQSISADNFEVVNLAWFTPQEALRLQAKKEISMIMPQQKTIEELATFKFADLLDMVELRKERDPARLKQIIPGPPPKKDGDDKKAKM